MTQQLPDWVLKYKNNKGILTYLSKVCIVEVNGEDKLGDVSRQTQKVIDLLEVPITETLGL